MTEYRLVTAEEFLPIAAAAEKYGVTDQKNCLRFIDTQLDKIYDVWLLQGEKGKFILKKDKKRKGDKTVFDTYFAGHDFAVPKILEALEIGDDLYVVMEYAEGEDARGCGAEDAARIGWELARIQSAYLTGGGHTKLSDWYFAEMVEDYWNTVKKRFPGYEEVYAFIAGRFFEAPHTLIHDDLLPINALVNREKVYILDWETSGIVPYFLDLGRFAFVTDQDDSFYISHDSAMAFLDAYYEEMRKNPAFTATKEEFLRDVAVSAFCQYVIFLHYEDDEERARETDNYKYMLEILEYLKRVK